MSYRTARVTALGMLALVAPGCMETASEQIRANMTGMVGQPAHSLFDRLGIPEAEGRVAGRKFYVWDTYEAGSVSVPQRHTGTIYNPYSPIYSSTYSHTTYQQVPYTHFCKLRVFVDSHERIVTYDLEGNEGGCGTFASQLGPKPDA